MGPDEYQGYPDADRPGLNNNTYTNVMVVWTLLRALETLEVLPPHYRDEVVEELRLGPDELDRWRDITRKMRSPSRWRAGPWRRRRTNGAARPASARWSRAAAT